MWVTIRLTNQLAFRTAATTTIQPIGHIQQSIENGPTKADRRTHGLVNCGPMHKVCTVQNSPGQPITSVAGRLAFVPGSRAVHLEPDLLWIRRTVRSTS